MVHFIMPEWQTTIQTAEGDWSESLRLGLSETGITWKQNKVNYKLAFTKLSGGRDSRMFWCYTVSEDGIQSFVAGLLMQGTTLLDE
jgi:hypothetical protein